MCSVGLQATRFHLLSDLLCRQLRSILNRESLTNAATWDRQLLFSSEFEFTLS